MLLDPSPRGAGKSVKAKLGSQGDRHSAATRNPSRETAGDGRISGGGFQAGGLGGWKPHPYPRVRMMFAAWTEDSDEGEGPMAWVQDRCHLA